MHTPIQLLNPPSLPDYIDYNFSHVAVVESPSRLIYSSGQIALTKDGHTPSDFEAQARLVFDNIKTCLKEAGASIHNLVMVTMYCTDFSVEATPIWKPYEEFLTDKYGTHRPPCVIIPVTRLGSPQWHLEVSVQAAVSTKEPVEKL
ncbi:Endoribonuclease L-PSP/chorismate mutase-like protein [Ilyonectria sp. MPI-CAGE-AT-0026]|nr:Endoribonuclease L-PSP/chorismate mutase-like protein [Ilyonectria sp. MPI-CAGE-AT-0026]